MWERQFIFSNVSEDCKDLADDKIRAVYFPNRSHMERTDQTTVHVPKLSTATSAITIELVAAEWASPIVFESKKDRLIQLLFWYRELISILHVIHIFIIPWTAIWAAWSLWLRLLKCTLFYRTVKTKLTDSIATRHRSALFPMNLN